MFKLTQTGENKPIFVAGINICAIVQNNKSSRIYFVGGLQLNVHETAPEIMNLTVADLEE